MNSLNPLFNTNQNSHFCKIDHIKKISEIICSFLDQSGKGFSNIVHQQLEIFFNKDLEIKRQILTQKNYIIIEVDDVIGCGNLLFAIRLKKILERHILNSSIALVYDNLETKNKIVSLIGENSNLFQFSKLPDIYKDRKNNRLYIGCAAFDTKEDLGGYEIIIKNDDCPVLLIPEYSCGNKNSISSKQLIYAFSGLGNNELGIFVDNLSTNQEDVRGINELQDIDLKNKILSNTSPQQYFSNTNLYFGYAHHLIYQNHFINFVVCLEKPNSKNIDMVLILDKFDNIDLLFNDTLKQNLLKQNIGLVEICYEKPLLIFLSEDKTKKKLRIFPRQHLSYKDVQTFLKISQPLVLITGDQSFSDAISFNKFFIYECYEHKIVFKINFIKIAHSKNLDLVVNFLSKTSDSIIPSPVLIDFYKTQMRRNAEFKIDYATKMYDCYEEIANYLLNNNFQSQWQQYISIIQSEYSIENKIVSLVGDILSRNFPGKIS